MHERSQTSFICSAETRINEISIRSVNHAYANLFKLDTNFFRFCHFSLSLRAVSLNFKFPFCRLRVCNMHFPPTWRANSEYIFIFYLEQRGNFLRGNHNLIVVQGESGSERREWELGVETESARKKKCSDQDGDENGQRRQEGARAGGESEVPKFSLVMIPSIYSLDLALALITIISSQAQMFATVSTRAPFLFLLFPTCNTLECWQEKNQIKT